MYTYKLKYLVIELLDFMVNVYLTWKEILKLLSKVTPRYFAHSYVRQYITLTNT